MIYSIEGTLALKDDHFAVVQTGGLGLKLFASRLTIEGLPATGADVKFYCHLHVREDALDLFGFTTERELVFFEMLIAVSGVGPRSALAILDTGPLDELSAAIKENRPDLLTRAPGIGRKTAERVIIELRNKVQAATSEATVAKMETDTDLLDALTSLGYRKEEARAALAKVGKEVEGTEARLRAALAVLSNKQK
jgi:holliday junction DNA helicase RuvA